MSILSVLVCSSTGHIGQFCNNSYLKHLLVLTVIKTPTRVQILSVLAPYLKHVSVSQPALTPLSAPHHASTPVIFAPNHDFTPAPAPDYAPVM